MLRYQTMTCDIQGILKEQAQLMNDIELVQYDHFMHKEIVPQIFKRTFNSREWGEKWDTFDGFYEEGVFLLYHKLDKYYMGFIISYINEGLPYIAAMGIMEEFRGKHLGTYLIKHVAQHYAKMGYKDLWVDVRPHSESFQNRCLHIGFRFVDEE